MTSDSLAVRLKEGVTMDAYMPCLQEPRMGPRTNLGVVCTHPGQSPEV